MTFAGHGIALHTIDGTVIGCENWPYSTTIDLQVGKRTKTVNIPGLLNVVEEDRVLLYEGVADRGVVVFRNGEVVDAYRIRGE